MFLLSGLVTGLVAGLLAGQPAAGARPTTASDPAPTLGQVTGVPLPGTGERFPVAATSDGATYVAATSTDPREVDPEWNVSVPGVEIAKVDADGRVVWTDTFSTEHADGANAVAAGPWGAVVLGRMNYVGPSRYGAGFWLRRYDPDGVLVWSRRFEVTDRINDLVVVGDDIFLVGDDGAYHSKPLVQRASLATGDLGEQALSEFDGPFGRSGLSRVEVWGEDLAVLAYSANEETDPLQVVHSVAVRKVSRADLGTTWTTTLDSDDYTHGQDLTISEGKAVVVGIIRGEFAGQTRQGAQDRFLAAINADGTQAWLRQFATSSGEGYYHEGSYGLTDTPTGLVSATTELMGESPWGPKLIRVDGFSSQGTDLWSTVIDTDGSEFASDLVYDAARGLRLVGVANGSLVGLDTDDLLDVFVAELVSDWLPPAPPATPVITATSTKLRPATVRMRRGPWRTTRLVVTNAGDNPAVLGVKGCRMGPRVVLRVRDGRRNVTGKVRRGTWRSPSLAPGKRHVLRVSVRATKRAATTKRRCAFVVRQPGAAGSRSIAKLKVVVRHHRR
ncbi:hypothetical protein GCM10027020_02530 [Nocardioides salsibiostraticola]